MRDRWERERGTDLVTGTVLGALGLYVMVEGAAMPRPAGWHSAPGLVPLVIGLWLAVMAAVLVAGGLRRGGWVQLRAATARWRGPGRDAPRTTWQAGFTLTALVAYIYLLLPRLPFEAATFLYLAVTMGVLWRRRPLAVALAAAGAAVAFSLVFSRFLRTVLPGAGAWL